MNQVLLLRSLGSSEASARLLDLDAILAGEAPDVPLQAYDVVFLPMKTIAKVGRFVDEYINAIIPTALTFPYNLNTTFRIEE